MPIPNQNDHVSSTAGPFKTNYTIKETVPEIQGWQCPESDTLYEPTVTSCNCHNDAIQLTLNFEDLLDLSDMD